MYELNAKNCNAKKSNTKQNKAKQYKAKQYKEIQRKDIAYFIQMNKISYVFSLLFILKY